MNANIEERLMKLEKTQAEHAAELERIDQKMDRFVDTFKEVVHILDGRFRELKAEFGKLHVAVKFLCWVQGITATAILSALLKYLIGF